jgi:hypothetical protein
MTQEEKLAKAVDENGTVNQEVLGTVLHSYEAGRSGRTAQHEAMIEVLIKDMPLVEIVR